MVLWYITIQQLVNVAGL